jgi:hypothetical protein
MNDKLTKGQRIILNKLLMRITIGDATICGTNIQEVMEIAKLLRYDQTDVNHPARIERREFLTRFYANHGYDFPTAAQKAADDDEKEAQE